ncbi:MAG TPA: DUF4383 domain-containing protein [Alphaproteobacteria bacterium]|nr:DUF4383 domain-containing protein [Alphaproteobacteria bacterium]
MANIQKTYAQIVGAVLALIGIAGFFVGEGLLMGFGVNILHSIIHLLSGILLIAFAGRVANLTFGWVYAAVFVLGLVAPGLMASLIHLNPADNYLHLALAVISLGVGYGAKE